MWTRVTSANYAYMFCNLPQVPKITSRYRTVFSPCNRTLRALAFGLSEPQWMKFNSKGRKLATQYDRNNADNSE